jgi:CDP-4-dehydro-6-deoxyglucose reductase
VELSYQVELKTSRKSFSVEADETVLEAALRQSINLPMVVKMELAALAKEGSLQEKLPMGTIVRAL